jgi:drug/metabolite transporter (DMT)-like permease
MYQLVCGLLGALCFVAGALFLRSYRRTGDRLFAMFATAFPILGLSQIFLGVFNHPEGNYPLAYIPRLLTFAIILVAIVDKNRLPRRARAPLHLVQRKEAPAALHVAPKRRGVG